MTEELFRTNSYLKACEAKVVAIYKTGVELDRTVFYSTGGGQPGDQGILRLCNGQNIEIVNCYSDRETGRHLHIPSETAVLLSTGDAVTAEINWERRYRLMRMHTCLHLLCALIEGGVTGGQVGEWKSRIDFDLPDTSLEKEQLTSGLNRLIEENHPVSHSSITDAELAVKQEQ